jgi:sugar/nucleoside kinase (ribokinase family)
LEGRATIINGVNLTVEPAIDYLVIGHVARDITPSGPQLGGTAAFAALTARALGHRPAVVTAAASDLSLTPLAGIPCACSVSPQSTTFENRTDGHRRRQMLLGRAAALTAADVPEAWQTAGLVHVGPIAGEIEPSWAASLPHSGLLGVTAQGWLRAWDEDGVVRPRPWAWARSGLAAADAVIVSLDDLGGDEVAVEEMAAVCRLLVVTEGARGATVHWNGDVRRVPVVPVAQVIDATGAGDVFATAFFSRLRATRDPWEAARFANVLASVSVTRPGLEGVPTADEIRRADLQVVR